jgi:hypothetical protein
VVSVSEKADVPVRAKSHTSPTIANQSAIEISTLIVTRRKYDVIGLFVFITRGLPKAYSLLYERHLL